MSYQEISDQQIAAGTAVTQQLMQRLRDNPIDSTIGDLSAPPQKLKEFTYPDSDEGDEIIYSRYFSNFGTESTFQNALYLKVQRAGDYNLYTYLRRYSGDSGTADVEWKRIRSGSTTNLKTINFVTPNRTSISTDLTTVSLLANDILYVRKKSTNILSGTFHGRIQGLFAVGASESRQAASSFRSSANSGANIKTHLFTTFSASPPSSIDFGAPTGVVEFGNNDPDLGSSGTRYLGDNYRGAISDWGSHIIGK